MNQLNTIFFIGPQGSGKGTQAKILAERLGYFHWDNGAICREAGKMDNEIGREVQQTMEKGLYLSDELLLKVAGQKLAGLPADQGIVFDGLPRRLSQAEFLMDLLPKQGRTNFITVFLDISKQESVKRIMKRAELEHRPDDTQEAVEKRLQQYYEQTLPILDFMKQHGKFVEIDGLGSIEETSQKINTALSV